MSNRYLFLIAYEPSDWSTATPEQQQAFFDAHHAYEDYVDQHGKRLSSGALADVDTATTVRHVDGAVTVTDGPYAETVESIGGYYDIELPDLDSAVEAAGLLPPSYVVEIRPTIVIEGYQGR